ncbi:MAG TPA: glycerophosphodiester phosphodiesterase [Terriglobales bacterium]|nr:glycerophosphodiester phosphodiesterase [Terriglobales bacterium]
MLLLGHRGAKSYAPENTLHAFDLAMEHGCDGFEFDVRLTKDNVAVIVHDPTVQDYVVADFTSQHLFTVQESTPTVEQVFEKYGQRAFLNVELKVVGIEQHVTDFIQRFPPSRGVLVSSFLPEAIRLMHARSAEHPLGYICRRKDLLKQWQKLPISHAVLHHGLITSGLMAELRAEGKKVITWTVNNKEEMVRVADLGVDGIISDDTRLLCDVLADRRAATPTI